MPEDGALAPALPRPAGRRAAWGLLPLLLAPVLVWRCWDAPFSRYDDAQVFHDPLLQPGASWAGLWGAHPQQFFYYPLTMLGWRVDREVLAPLLEPLAGEHAWPAAIRLHSLLLHVLGGLFVWLALRRLRAGAALAAFAAAGFVLHPTACESVCWAIERKNVLAGTLGFLALWLYVRAACPRGHALAALAFLAALLAKASALGLFAVAAAWELLGRPSLGAGEAEPGAGAPARAWPRALARLAPWAALSACFAWLGYRLQAAAILPPPGGSVFTAILTDHHVLRRYIENFLWPAGASAFYGIDPIRSLGDAHFWLDAAFVYGFAAATILFSRPADRRAAAFGWLWFAGAMAPTLNLVGITFVMQDRYAYLGAPGFWLALGLAARGLFARWAARGGASPLPSREGAEGGPKAKPSLQAPLALAAVAVFALFWAWASLQRGGLFAETGLLFADAAAKEPRSAYANLFLVGDLRAEAERLYLAGEKDAAAARLARCRVHLERGVAAPDFERYLAQPEARLQLARLYLDAGRAEEAAAQARAALAPSFDLPVSEAERREAATLQGRAALRLGRPDEALAQFNRALQLSPDDAESHLGAAKALLSLRDFFAARQAPEQAAEMRRQALEALRRVPKDAWSVEEARELLRHEGE
ncbi:MAG: tetratricopeptide repeat protein [Planctomycetota bacterium]|nr:tetratricopeptide repeat protein [Planctomycetota bacterium]